MDEQLIQTFPGFEDLELEAKIRRIAELEPQVESLKDLKKELTRLKKETIGRIVGNKMGQRGKGKQAWFEIVFEPKNSVKIPKDVREEYSEPTTKTSLVCGLFGENAFEKFQEAVDSLGPDVKVEITTLEEKYPGITEKIKKANQEDQPGSTE